MRMSLGMFFFWNSFFLGGADKFIESPALQCDELKGGQPKHELHAKQLLRFFLHHRLKCNGFVHHKARELQEQVKDLSVTTAHW